LSIISRLLYFEEDFNLKKSMNPVAIGFMAAEPIPNIATQPPSGCAVRNVIIAFFFGSGDYF
jgi:hypothetical protein